MTSFQKDIFSLIRSALDGSAAEISDNFDWAQALDCGYKSKILPLLYYGAYNSGIKIPENIDAEFQTATVKYLMHNEQQLFEFKRISDRFEEEKIKYVPLKGILQKKLYPKPEMRPMGDIDILIDKSEQYDKISRIMTELGYVSEKESDHELVWIKSRIMIELHKRLIPSYNQDYYKYFGDGWGLVHQADPNSTRYIFTPEDNFIYLFTHFAKHYRDAGIGILHLTDLYVFLNANRELDRKYLRTELKKLELFEFFVNIEAVIDVCFKNAPVTELTDFIIDKIFGSGCYGLARSHTVSVALKKTKGVKNKKLIHETYLIKRIFMPYREMCRRNPILTKLPFLLPLFWIYRIFSLLFKRNNMKSEIAKLKAVDADTVTDYYNDLKYVGLDFDFKE